MTVEEELIQRYFDAFNSHDIEGVMACFHENPVVVDATGTRLEGREEVRQDYETGFALMPDCRCDLRMLIGNSGRGVAESYFHGTRPRYGKLIEAIGAEVIEIVDERIKEIRDYHRALPSKAA
jgi:ketosteroid isomerase-like protein